MKWINLLKVLRSPLISLLHSESPSVDIFVYHGICNYFVGSGTHNQIILHSVKPVMVILHWRSGTEPMRSTIGTGMMMGKKYRPILLYFTISTGKYDLCQTIFHELLLKVNVQSLPV